MERIKSFDEFYDLKLKDEIERLQRENKKADKWGIMIFISAFALIPVVVYGLKESSGNAGKFIIGLMVILVVVSARNYARVSTGFETNFKEQIVKTIIDFIQPGLAYKPEVYMSSGYFRNSGLFNTQYNVYDGDDLVEGTYKNVFFKCSELEVALRKTRGASRHIFHGLFFAATVNRKFSAGTYVFSNAEDDYPAKRLPAVVKLDCRNGEFEKYYRVYTTNVSQGSLIVDAAMMANLTAFMKQIRRKVDMSVVGGMCYVAIPFTQDLFEPPSPYEFNKEEIKEYFYTVLLMLSIINQLQLEKLQ